MKNNKETIKIDECKTLTSAQDVNYDKVIIERNDDGSYSIKCGNNDCEENKTYYLVHPKVLVWSLDFETVKENEKYVDAYVKVERNVI